MHVLFVEPAFPKNQREFVRALHSVGARVTGIGESPLEALDDELKRWLYRYEQVRSVTDENALLSVVRRCQAREWVDRLESTVEAHTLPVAKVREACQIPGTSVRTAFLCRDKPAMKEALRQAGIPCAQSIGASSTAEVREFAARVGYPLILKPRDAAGAAGTYKVTNDAELEGAMRECGLDRGYPTAIEEFNEGHEGFYDTLSIEGTVQHDFISHYYPNVLEAMRTRWISPQICTTNRVHSPDYAEVKAMGAKVIQALGIETSATHMEWFFGPKGLRFSEIGCRPPGVRVWDIYSHANEFDLYREWAFAIAHGRVDRAPSRTFAGGMIALRPECDGRITGYDGFELVQQRVGANIIDCHLPPPGSATQPVGSGYMGNAWVRMKHHDYDGLRAALNFVGENLKVRARAD
ncbi:MAG: ATP-grasp domain-containing protein [Planctomycetes bacterium]|nr:ATP-grasp domain-containing protein [Planctomycetota bacterium]